MNLIERYRPKRLSDIIGQPQTIAGLSQWLAAPYSTGMIFAGPTGTGKSSAALALASELGCDINNPDLGGLSQIASGEQDGKGVRDMLRLMTYIPWNPSGWRVLIVNEADNMTSNAAYVWLDGLENLGQRRLVIFTTNEPGKLQDRLRDRCEQYRFDGSGTAVEAAARQLAARVWTESGRGDVPDDLPYGLGAGNQISFRRLLQQMQQRLREPDQPKAAAAAAPRIAAVERQDFRGYTIRGTVLDCHMRSERQKIERKWPGARIELTQTCDRDNVTELQVVAPE